MLSNDGSKYKNIKIYITYSPTLNKAAKQTKKEDFRKMCDETRTSNKCLCALCFQHKEKNCDKMEKHKMKMNKHTCPFCWKQSEIPIQDASKDNEVNLINNRKIGGKHLENICKGPSFSQTLAEPTASKIEKKQMNRNDINKQEKLAKEVPTRKSFRKYSSIDDSNNKLEKIIPVEVVQCVHDLEHKNNKSVNTITSCMGRACEGLGSNQVLKDTNIVGQRNDKLADNKKDLENGLNLLNEVLSVFHNQKHEPKCIAMTNSGVNCNDVSVQVSDLKMKKLSSLSVSRIIKYSILDENMKRDHPKFIILESHQPENLSKTHSLPRYKSSSVPQMKLEELKFAMKEKNRSKDTVGEVNRMFAVVGKYIKESKDDLNRPMIRNGPRVLPVVKTDEDRHRNKRRIKDNFSEISDKHWYDMKSCNVCQTNDHLMSGGDSIDSLGYTNDRDRCEKCVHMLSCHHNDANAHVGLKICACCKQRNVVSHCAH